MIGVPDNVSASWTTFTRRDLRTLTDVLRAVAVSGDAGRHGHGVEVVIESPPLRVWERVFRLRQRRRERDSARIAVTNADGHCGYPVHVRLDTTHGAVAAKHIARRPGWATSNTAGQAILMMKARAAATADYDALELATGTVDALADLHWREPMRGWRFRVDRMVIRT